jgi:hypothetical protein
LSGRHDHATNDSFELIQPSGFLLFLLGFFHTMADEDDWGNVGEVGSDDDDYDMDDLSEEDNEEESDDDDDDDDDSRSDEEKMKNMESFIRIFTLAVTTLN